MDLEPKIAKTIVTNLKDIVNHEINLFDTSGTIIASTDEKRVGTSHDGALLAARTKETLTIDFDNQFEGARKGINMPVMFNDSVVAIIGITGERSEVEPFANIIRKMTEILLRENWLQISTFNQRMNYSNLVNMLISKDRDQTYTDYLSAILNFDLSLKRRVIVGEFTRTDQQNIDYGELNHIIYNRLHPFSDSIFTVSEQKVLLLLEPEDDKIVNNTLVSLTKDIELHYQRSFVFGIGNYMKETDNLWLSYQEAQTVVNWHIHNGSSIVKSYTDLDIELIFASISPENSNFFIQRVLGPIPEKKLDEYEAIFKIYTKYNGSITQGAEELFIHKNTFQNKLNRLSELTGYNPRNLKDYVVLDMAFSLLSHLKGMASTFK